MLAIFLAAQNARQQQSLMKRKETKKGKEVTEMCINNAEVPNCAECDFYDQTAGKCGVQDREEDSNDSESTAI